jgi:hypothetical protein
MNEKIFYAYFLISYFVKLNNYYLIFLKISDIYVDIQFYIKFNKV